MGDRGNRQWVDRHSEQVDRQVGQDKVVVLNYKGDYFKREL